MRMTKSKNNNSLTTTPSLSSESQTPIEIALQIDENGMTTASNLYAFLELHPAHFSDWCKRNIKNNSAGRCCAHFIRRRDMEIRRIVLNRP